MSTAAHHTHCVSRCTILLLAALGLTGIHGCGMNASPVASNAGASLSPAPMERSYLVFAPRGMLPAGKPAALSEEGTSVSRTIGPRGGRLVLTDRGPGRLPSLLRAELGVPRGALDERVDITMTLYGHVLSQLVAVFQPGGLVFQRNAVLSFQLTADRVDIPLSDITVYHIDDSGHTEEARIISVRTYGRRPGGEYAGIVIKIAVPGFSRYGLQGSL